MALKPITVTQLNDYISRVLTTDPLLGNIRVSGEISNLKYHSSGHVYFSINDADSKVNCFFPASYVRNLDYELGDGLEIIINGYINVYKKGGTYTLFVKSIEVSGEGNLQMAFELLKDKLNRKGLFDQGHKKRIPQFPSKVGIVTSETGAAVQDIIKIISTRTKLVDIIVFPVKVQGEGSAQDIAEMIDFVNANNFGVDTLIVGRGGGSTEDLWAFNEEIVARAIYNSHIPVISAVGHEIDFTISDFVADMRAETPTQAAKLAVPDTNELLRQAEILKENIEKELANKIRYNQLLINNFVQEMKNTILQNVVSYEHQLERLKLILDENNPYAILSKGYAVLTDSKGRVVNDASVLNENDPFEIRLKDEAINFRFTDLKIRKV